MITQLFPNSHNAHLLVGNKVVCTGDVLFSDNTQHKRGQTYTVDPKTQAYFSLFTGDAPHCRYIKIEG